ncbi:MAG: endo alpha-1,4 polygalactosaminidase [Fibrobacteria bacterium]
MSALYAEGRKVICYIDFGFWETGRPDANQFPSSVLGATYKGFPDERWLDIRRIDSLAPILRTRLDQALAKGCDAVEPDNMDGYDTTAHEFSGFIAANKPVFEAEYGSELSEFCPEAIQLNFSAIRKRNDLNAFRESCR